MQLLLCTTIAFPQIVIDDFNDGDIDGWFEGSSKYDISYQDSSLRVDVTGVYGWRVFGKNFTKIDMSNFTTISVKIMIPDTADQVVLRLDLSDNNGLIGNRYGFNFLPIRDGQFHEYILDYNNKLYQGWNSEGNPEIDTLDPTNIVKAEFFTMPGATQSSAWSGVMFIDDIVLLGAQDPKIIRKEEAWSHWNENTPASNWNDTTFVDTWPQITTEAGYGDGDEQTTLGFGTDSSNRYITQYFRKDFNITDTTAYSNLILNLKADDGAIAYLNGNEIVRKNMPVGAVDSSTLASTDITDSLTENSFERYILPISSLFIGKNTVAVEVHQADNTNEDMSFELYLSATPHETGVIRGPYLQSSTDTSIIVRWRTLEETNGLVRFGTSLNNQTTLVTDSISQEDHEILITGLSPGTKYFYSLGTLADDTLAGGDDSYYFKTHPTPGSDEPFSIWVTGDAGRDNGTQREMRDAYYQYKNGERTDIWLLLGDNAYEEGTEEEYQAAMFEKMFEEILKQTNLYPAPGNHDLRNYDDPINEAPYFDIFSLPMNGEAGGTPSGTEAYYSFDYGNTHFISLDSYSTERDSTGAMANWLKNDIANTDKKWKIAYWHHPPYSKGSHDSDDTSPDESGGRLIDMREQIVPLLENDGVDLVLTGHSHNYERSFLVNGHYGFSNTLLDEPHFVTHNGDARNSGKLDEGEEYYKNPTDASLPNKGTVYAVLGCSGLTTSDPAWADDAHNLLTTTFFKYSSSDFIGSMAIDIDDDTLHAKFIDNEGNIQDYFSLVKDESKNMSLVTGVVADVEEAVESKNILKTIPNPHDNSVRIEYNLEHSRDVTLQVVDMSGKIVATLIDHRKQAAGDYNYDFNSTDAGLSSGGYLVRLQTDKEVFIKRILKY